MKHRGYIIVKSYIDGVHIHQQYLITQNYRIKRITDLLIDADLFKSENEARMKCVRLSNHPQYKDIAVFTVVSIDSLYYIQLY